MQLTENQFKAHILETRGEVERIEHELKMIQLARFNIENCYDDSPGYVSRDARAQQRLKELDADEARLRQSKKLRESAMLSDYQKLFEKRGSDDMKVTTVEMTMTYAVKVKHHQDEDESRIIDLASMFVDEDKIQPVSYEGITLHSYPAEGLEFDMEIQQ